MTDLNPIGAALQAISRSRQQLIHHNVALRTDPRVKQTGSGVDVREYSGGLHGTPEWCVELWAEAELHDDTDRTWWIEVVWDGSACTVASRLLIDSIDGQEQGWEGRTRTPRTADELVAAIAEATDELLAQPIPPYEVKKIVKKRKGFFGR